jgi:hypothetical protein
MNPKIAVALVSTMKVIGHLLVAAIVTEIIVFFSHRPDLVFYMPVVNIVTAFLIKYFSITPDELPTIDTAPPTTPTNA